MTRIEFPRKTQFLFKPKRYKVIKGGRGSAKSWSVARALALRAVSTKLRILCAREIQNSIRESVHRLLSDQIEALGLGSRFKIQENEIVGANGSEFIFAGLRSNPHKIKSTEGVDICWVEEAEKVSQRSLEMLIPTIRKPGSELWFTFNPDEESDPVYQYFVTSTPPDADVVTMNWQDNPWFPDELKREKDYLFTVDPEAAEHIWGGQCRKSSNAQIFKGKYEIADFTVDRGVLSQWSGPYFGADWGFAEDPATLVKLWTLGNRLYVEFEAWGQQVENDALATLFLSVPEADKYQIRADSSRPETIHHVRKRGLNVTAAEKWSGSVEDGIQYLRSFEKIVIHPRCKRMIDEARLYRYKVDPLTDDVLPVIVDKHNHLWDAIRYAMEPAIRRDKLWQPHPDELVPADLLEAQAREQMWQK